LFDTIAMTRNRTRPVLTTTPDRANPQNKKFQQVYQTNSRPHQFSRRSLAARIRKKQISAPPPTVICPANPASHVKRAASSSHRPPLSELLTIKSPRTPRQSLPAPPPRLQRRMRFHRVEAAPSRSSTPAR
jgi:hypothetical protein